MKHFNLYRLLLYTTNILAIISSVFFGIIWLARINMNYNTEGRFFDPHSGIVYKDGAVLIYGTLAFIFLFISITSLIFIFKSHRNKIT